MITSCSYTFPSMVTEPNRVRSILGFIVHLTTPLPNGLGVGLGELSLLDHRAPAADAISDPQQRALPAAALGPAGKASLDLRPAPQHPEHLDRVLALVRLGQLHGMQLTGVLDPTEPIVGNRRQLPPQAPVSDLTRVGSSRIDRVELLQRQLLLHVQPTFASSIVPPARCGLLPAQPSGYAYCDATDRVNPDSGEVGGVRPQTRMKRLPVLRWIREVTSSQFRPHHTASVPAGSGTAARYCRPLRCREAVD